MATHHVIIGGGPAATNALETLREHDPQARITLVCDEPAHSRMALPYWLSSQIPREHTMTADDGYYDRLQIEARIGSRVTGIDHAAKQLSLANGESLGFDKLLVATGSSPTGLPVEGGELPGVQPLWTLDDTAGALSAVDGKSEPRVVLVGAGFIGFIVLNAMHKRGWRLAVVEREAQVLPRMLDAGAAGVVEAWLQSRGVAVHTGATVQAIRAPNGEAKVVELDNGQRLEADLVIVATGVRPNLECVQGSGIEVDEGILVDEHMRTSLTDVYAAGDVAQGPVLFDEAKAIHAIQPTAIDHGRVAAANMAGRDVRYPGSLSMNVLDACGLQCASYGNWGDARAEPMTIANPRDHVYRRLLWTGDEITGAIFIGRSNDLGMLTDVGMVKGIMQTRTRFGDWKAYLAENPFDIRRPYVATRVAEKLVGTTLLGRPARSRGFHYGGAGAQPAAGAAHAAYMTTRGG